MWSVRIGKFEVGLIYHVGRKLGWICKMGIMFWMMDCVVVCYRWFWNGLLLEKNEKFGVEGLKM